MYCCNQLYQYAYLKLHLIPKILLTENVSATDYNIISNLPNYGGSYRDPADNNIVLSHIVPILIDLVWDVNFVLFPLIVMYFNTDFNKECFGSNTALNVNDHHNECPQTAAVPVTLPSALPSTPSGDSPKIVNPHNNVLRRNRHLNFIT